MNVSGSDRCQFPLIKKVRISAMITFVYVKNNSYFSSTYSWKFARQIFVLLPAFLKLKCYALYAHVILIVPIQ